MDYGYVIKRNDNDFVINVDLNILNSGYNVVPKSVDPYNAYEIEDVITYCNNNPDKVLTSHPLEAQAEKERELAEKEAELAEINSQIFEVMVQDFSNKLHEVQTLPENKEAIIELLNQKNTLMNEIEALKNEIESMTEGNV